MSHANSHITLGTPVENRHGFQQTTTGFNFVSKTRVEKFKIYSINPNTLKVRLSG